jgi:DeoR family transcriptional regulator, fructose operon transcriptional repressor
MKFEERKRFIMGRLSQFEQVEVVDITDAFQVSAITARRDLDQLEKEGLLVRTHGGAIKQPRIATKKKLFSYDEKAEANKERKEYIASVAVKLIQEGDVIFIDSGSTLYHLAAYLKNFENLIVITNSLPVTSDLLGHPNIGINLIGGEVDHERKAVYGLVAANTLEHYHVNKAFIGADGVSLHRGLTTYDEKEAAISRKIAAAADEVYLLSDSSKIEKNSFVKFAPLSILKALVTDYDLPAEIKSAYSENGITIIN